jgi:GT2 family glycosyltransferase
VSALDPGPDRVVVVLSGNGVPPPEAAGYEVVTTRERLGFAAAVNLGVAALGSNLEMIAVVNDDAEPSPTWLATLVRALSQDDRLVAVQGTVLEARGDRIDGRGISLDQYGLPVQRDRGLPAEREAETTRPVLSVSGTAAVYRSQALARVSSGRSSPLDPAFGSYHEDLDLGLRIRRLGLGAAWVGGAPTRHLGSATGATMRWRHPWWVLANRWRALAANLTPGALLAALPRLLRGELRAVRTLSRDNARAVIVALAVAVAWPHLVAGSWRRATPGPRLTALPRST